MHISTLQVLTDPVRFTLVEQLLELGEQPVTELVAKVSIHQTGVSRHLRLLRDAGIVKVRAEGSHRYYSLCPEPFREVHSWASRYRTLWEGRLDALEAEVQRRKSTTSNNMGNS